MAKRGGRRLKTYVIKRSGRSFLYMKAIDASGKVIAERSTGETRRRAAERVAAEWEAELLAGRSLGNSAGWEEFYSRYQDEQLSYLSDGYAATMNAAVARLAVETVGEIDASELSKYRAAARRDGLAASTVRTYLKHLRALLSWAKRVGVIEAIPHFPVSEKSAGGSRMKGRPLTDAEFSKILKVVEKVRPGDAEQWTELLRGLWLSGLRLSEACRLTWHLSGFCIDTAARRPLFRIEAESHKGRRNELLPLTPDFARLILKTPESDRSGLVWPVGVTADCAGRIISAIGEAAGVVTVPGKFATAHDLRRSFGTRWASRVKPAVLQRLMRHGDIKTTMAYYVDLDAGDIAESLWDEF